MRHRRIIITIFACIVAIGPIIYLAVSHEPRYQGRSLSDWIADGKKARRYHDSAGWNTASHAVQEMSDEAIPRLLKWASTPEDSQRKRSLIGWLHRHPWMPIHMRSYISFKSDARFGFQLLDDKAKPAWPTLVKWTCEKDRNHRFDGVFFLPFVKADKATRLPVLIRLMSDPDIQIRQEVGMQLNFDFPKEAEAAGFYKLYPDWKKSSDPDTTDQQTDK